MSWQMSKMNRRYTFSAVAMLIATAVFIFITLTMLCIVMEGAANLDTVFQNDEVLCALKLSFCTAFLSTGICILLGIPSAYALACIDFQLKPIYNVMIELPLSLPDVMLGLSLLLMFSTMPGRWLSLHGIKFIFHINGIILAQLIVNLPFFIRFVKTAFMESDPHMEIVAESLGANSFHTFFLITLPMCGNVILSASILAWSRALGEFGATQMLVGATRLKTETLSTGIHLNMGSGDSKAAIACAMLLLMLSLPAQTLSYIGIRKKIGLTHRRNK